MALSLARYGEISFKNGRVQQNNFDSYQVGRIDESPAITHVHIVPAGIDVPSSGRHCQPGAASGRHQRRVSTRARMPSPAVAAVAHGAPIRPASTPIRIKPNMPIPMHTDSTP